MSETSELKSGKNKLTFFFEFILNILAGINLLLFMFFPAFSHNTFNNNFEQIFFLTNISVLLLNIIINYFPKKQITKLNFAKLLDTLVITISFLLLKHTKTIIFIYIIIKQIISFISKIAKNTDRTPLLKKVFHYPALIILISFLSAILIGTIALSFPQMTNADNSTNIIGASFIATSAVCVTGLSIYDISSHFTIYGQIIILFLIQIGGLGIMTISTALAIILGQKFSVKSERIINFTITQKQNLNLFGLVKNIVFMTFLIEFFGAVILFFPFYKEFSSFSKSVYYAIFHSISAFCNAGFSLFPDSLMNFYKNIFVIIPVSILIIFGGLGFSVITDLFQHNFNPKKFKYLSFHSKIVLTTSLILVMIGTLVFFISEYQFTMKNMNLPERLISSFFQSTTTRTAGFNSIDTSEISNSSMIFTSILMFIGASPGSTGGGIKTTTFAITILAVIAFLKGRRDVTVFCRKISDETMIKVLALLAISTFFLFFIIFLLLIFEPLEFKSIIFEAFSAFGTVGLSMGITPSLNNLSKLLIILLMFIGRVGPLTFVFALAASITKRKYEVPEEQLDIG